MWSSRDIIYQICPTDYSMFRWRLVSIPGPQFFSLSTLWISHSLCIYALKILIMFSTKYLINSIMVITFSYCNINVFPNIRIIPSLVQFQGETFRHNLFHTWYIMHRFVITSLTYSITLQYKMLYVNSHTYIQKGRPKRHFYIWTGYYVSISYPQLPQLVFYFNIVS